MFKKVVVLFLTLFLAICLTFCGKDDNPTNATPSENVSFENDIQPIFTNNCSSSQCHGSGASAGLNLTSGQAYTNLVDVNSTQKPDLKRVLANDADNSYLAMKLENRNISGNKMPPSGSLSDASISAIKQWINEGAKNN